MQRESFVSTLLTRQHFPPPWPLWWPGFVVWVRLFSFVGVPPIAYHGFLDCFAPFVFRLCCPVYPVPQKVVAEFVVVFCRFALTFSYGGVVVRCGHAVESVSSMYLLMYSKAFFRVCFASCWNRWCSRALWVWFIWEDCGHISQCRIRWLSRSIILRLSWWFFGRLFDFWFEGLYCFWWWFCVYAFCLWVSVVFAGRVYFLCDIRNSSHYVAVWVTYRASWRRDAL